MSMIHCIDCIHRKVCKYNSFTHPSQIIDGTCFDYKNCDVVPKSEVEELIVNIADLIWQGEDEKLNIPMGGRYFSKQEFIAELKKEYVGGE